MVFHGGCVCGLPWRFVCGLVWGTDELLCGIVDRPRQKESCVFMFFLFVFLFFVCLFSFFLFFINGCGYGSVLLVFQCTFATLSD